MQDKKKLTAIILAALAIIVFIISFINKGKLDGKKDEISIVTNASNFYTVNSCLYRLTTYISTKDVDSLMLLIDEKYKEKNKVTKDNILEILPVAEGNDTFVSNKMYYSKLTDNITKYYVQGYIEQNKLFDDEVITELDNELVYFVVYLDSEEKIFSIEPYDGKIFMEGDLNER